MTVKMVSPRSDVLHWKTFTETFNENMTKPHDLVHIILFMILFIINNGVRTFHLDDTEPFIEYLLLRNEMHFKQVIAGFLLQVIDLVFQFVLIILRTALCKCSDVRNRD